MGEAEEREARGPATFETACVAGCSECGLSLALTCAGSVTFY